MNKIYCGDCESVLQKMPEESVDLIYIDPPFFTQTHYEAPFGDGSAIKAFQDNWYNKDGTRGDIYCYLNYMEPRLEQMYRVLKPTGSFYLHCDWHADFELRRVLNKIFGEKTFRNEIIWHYMTYQGQVKKYFPRKHDIIYFFTKSDDWTFNLLYQDNVEDTINFNRWKKYVVDGRYILGGNYPSTDTRFMAYYKRWVKEHGREPEKDEVLLELTGYVVDDVWDIKAVDPKSRERLGYPTQKPEALLKRIILASSNPGDVVLDPMCGCGTTLAAAYQLDREWIGIDVSPTACKLMVERLQALDCKITEIDIVNLPVKLKDLRKMNPFEFQKWCVDKLFGRVSSSKSGDMGIDGYSFDGTPIQVKQSEGIGRNVIDNFQTAIRRTRKNQGIIIGFSFTRTARNEVARAKREDGLDIELKTVKQLLKQTMDTLNG